jgi:GTP-binding protein HflX
MAKLYDIASVFSVDYQAEGISVVASVSPEYLERYRKYVVGDV